MKLILEALQANDGDCLLLHHQNGTATTRVLIDGGARGIYWKILRRRLDALRNGKRLDLRMLMVSHIDADHITGLVDMFRAMKKEEEDTGETFCRIARSGSTPSRSSPEARRPSRSQRPSAPR